MTPAGKLQAYLRKRVEALGGQYRKAQWENRVGCPDCYVWLDSGVYAWIEIKAGADRLSPHQEREIAFMQGAGLRVYVAKTTADIDVILEELQA